MKTFFLSLFSAILLSGCTNSGQITKKDDFNAEPFILDKINTFERNNPDLGKNEILTKKLNPVLLDSISLWMKDSLALNRTRFVISELSEVQDGNELVSIARGDLSLDYSNNNNKLNLKALLILDPKHVTLIQSGKKYFVNGNVRKVLLEPSDYTQTALGGEYNLGSYLVKLDSVWY
ncbi:hypothetical protein [Sphingobacterium psychroaquaticum]|uniref:Uncharacterized protein n=1 Tax=Sphingobacterium psychroaquaticum TaxID=561061 RepID=A0A1X7K4Z6_9SPHI|nr:hypothetical protein [Sphingobacterium psychroaquaticum]SMG35667.1 hypothetical protein SAMN05660862_2536 [Sphingobacterium psychroaquaticum]